MRKLVLSVLLCAIASYSVAKADTLSPDTAAMAESLLLSRFYPMAFNGASAVQYRLPFSINRLSVTYSSDRNDKSINEKLGRGGNAGCFRADAYMKYKSSTLHGFALYDNGEISDLRWNETSDYKRVYPYLTADAIGGDMRYEHYNFGGGYADSHRRWEWGVFLSYEAGQYYRNVDPRPKNITGLLTLNAGGGFRIFQDYHLSVTAGYERYTQSNSIKFVSEMGETKIYHLTGLGTHYVRFAGNGLSSHYAGNSFSGKINLIPGFNRGLILSAEGRCYRFEKILDDLNKLPLAAAKENSFRMEIGWRSKVDTLLIRNTRSFQSSFAIKGVIETAKRTGYENIFGDPASSIYPQIGSEERFHSTNRAYGASFLWQRAKGTSRSVSLEIEGVYDRFHRNYLRPVRFNTLESLLTSVKLTGSLPLPFRINGRLEINANYYQPLKNSLYIDSERITDDEGATDSFLLEVGNANTPYTEVGGKIKLLRNFIRKFTRVINQKLFYH